MALQQEKVFTLNALLTAWLQPLQGRVTRACLRLKAEHYRICAEVEEELAKEHAENARWYLTQAITAETSTLF